MAVKMVERTHDVELIGMRLVGRRPVASEYLSCFQTKISERRWVEMARLRQKHSSPGRK